MNLLSRPNATVHNDRRALLEERLRLASAEPETIPLSFAQQRIWLLDQLEPSTALYNVPLALEFIGRLNDGALEKALQQLTQRHEILRTRFQCVNEVPVQVVEETNSTRLQLHDLTGFNSAEREEEARRLLQEEVKRPFDLSTGPLLRAALLRLELQKHWFVLTFHHIVSDEWSLRICLRELSALYDSFDSGRVSGLPELPIQYADYTFWQRDRLTGELLEKQLAYWRRQLQGTSPALELPTDHPRPAVPGFHGNTIAHAISPSLSTGLKAVADRSGASLFMVLLAAFKTLLHRYTGQADIVVGSPIAGRNQLETEDLIGFFVNTLVLRTSLEGDPTFENLLQRIRETTLGAFANQDLPFEKLVESLRPERTLYHNAFTRVMFAMQNQVLDTAGWPGLSVRPLGVHTETAKFDLTFVVQESRKGLIACVEYNCDLFTAETIQRMLGHFETLLEGVAANPQSRLSDLPLLREDERRLIVSDWNHTATAYPKELSVAQLFETQAELTPHAIAISYGSESLTYAELNARANQLARHLAEFAVGPDVPVGLCLQRSPSLVIAMLAILKAGGAYLPLDSAYPKPRLAHMLKDAKAPVLITQQHLLSYLPRGGARVICLDSDWELIARQSQGNVPNRVTADDIAYVIYTSGSTGQPKGVAVRHRAIVRLVLNTDYIKITPADCIAQASNTSFDAATFEIWGALLNGARLVGISSDVALSPRDFACELREQKVSVLFLTTALFNQIAADQPDAFASIRVLLFGGEAVDPKWVRAVLQHPPQHLLHVYGPTENTTFSTWHEIRGVAPEALTIPIGRPIANSECYVLDAKLNPVPVGIPGNLHVGGDGLARGYWNQPELTAQKFIPNPFNSREPSQLLYKTGDIVRWRADGNLEFLGRADQQVKLRGFRVELGEIESLLTQHPSIRECVVTVYDGSDGDRKLAAYFVPRARRSPGVPELRSFLKEKLPDYMVPTSFMRLEALPLTPNGKIDRRALPEPDRIRPELEKRYASPQDAVEVELTRIWEDVLGLKPIGIEDKFFELGGHSLLAVRVIAQIEKQFGRRLKLATIFQAQTIEQLAAILRKEIQEDSAISGTSIVEIQPKGSQPPLFFVHGAGGGMFWGYVNLSRHLGPDQPVYGLRSRGLDGREEFKTIEQMAIQYIADLRVLQPHGPYHIGGYCFGGNVAYEMARRLQADGEEVRTLALFNCAPANSRYSRISWSPKWLLRFGINLCYWAKYFARWTPPQRREFFRWKTAMLQRRASRFLGHLPESKATVDAGELVDLSSFSEEQRKLWESHICALVNYHPQPYPGRVSLFRSPGHPWLCSFDADYGWGDLAQGGVEIVVVPGVHEKILEEPCVETLARELSSLLQRSLPPETVTGVPAASAAAVAAPSATAPSPETAATTPQAEEGPAADEELFDPAGAKAYSHYFEIQVARLPEAIALRFQEREYTYAELNARANQLAHRLRSVGVGCETLVAVCLERSMDLPVALLAILKAGGAYLPLDRSYPAERLEYMLQDSRASVLLTHRRSMPTLGTDGPNVICLDDPEEQRQLSQLPSSNPLCASTADSLAYVIYTSGSTGKPKGVEITHRSLLNHNFAMGRVFNLSPADRVLQFSPYSFDISVEEIFPTWLNGAALVLRTDDVLSSAERFLKFVKGEGISVLNLPTAYWHELVEYSRTTELPDCLRLVVIGGERASDEAWRRWKDRAGTRVTLINTYGPTETTVSATLHIGQPHDETLPIGRPIDNVSALILDANLKPVSNGDTGELYLGGAGVSRGYLNRPELTQQKFIANPFPDVRSDRLYRTGDLVRRRSDGELEFVGRVDEQVKIRGYRIELGEIESALRSHPDLREAVVVAREDTPGRKKLVAYFIARENASVGASELRHFLKEKLPAYMVPSAFVPLETLPMTPAGKVDRTALPQPGEERPELDSQYLAPRTPVEEVIAGIWAEVLRLRRVGVQDNFFDLGGHSLLATQVISRMREALQVDVPLGDLFDRPTVAELSAHLTSAGSGSQPVLPASAVSNGKKLPLSPAQQRRWFLDQFEPDQSSYNIPTTLRLKGPLDVPALERSLTELARRHEALRTIFATDDGQPMQIICDPKDLHLPITDLRDVAPDERETRATAIAIQEGRKSYVMSTPMLRPFLWRLDDDDYLLLLLTHELGCDGRSVGLLIDELTALYDAFARNVEPQLPLPGLSYSEFAAASQQTSGVEPDRLAFWKKQLEGAPALLALPSDRSRPAHQSDEGDLQPFQLGSQLTEAVERLGEDLGCTPATILLTVFQTLLSRYTGSPDIVVGSTASNGQSSERQNMVANLENLFAVRADLSGDPLFSEAVRRSKATYEAALAHADVPFERVVAELRPVRNPSYTPLVQVMFTYDETPLSGKEAAGVRFEPVKTHNQTSKLDLWLYLARTADGLSCSIEYSTALFDRERMARMTGHFENLVQAVAANPEQRLSELPLMSPDETRRVLVEWNATTKPYPQSSTLMERFEQQVLQTPHAPALIAGHDRLSYAELNARANQLAHYLRTLKVGPGVLVGICLERSWRLMVGMLGVLKAGGAYVPLDPAYPKDRLQFILADTSAPILLTQQSMRGLLPETTAQAVCLDSDWPEIQRGERANPAGGATGSDLAYVIYTSGSTGKPKGVAIENRNAVALMFWARDVFTREELSGVLASTSICFDLSIFEMFVPLSWGGTVILAQNALALPTLPTAKDVTLVNTVPSAIRELLRIKGVPPGVRVVNLAGEPLATTLVNQIYADTQVEKVYDLYGPSETTTYSTFTLRQPEAPATIGKPLDNEQVYVLDAKLAPVPIGIPGELYIGGDKVARGYLNRPELTAERFIPNPFSTGSRLYRTGDLVRWRTDGNLEFLGRLDHQVKIRGFRVELGEIESAYRKHTGVRDVLVLAQETATGTKRLIAYVVADPEHRTGADELRRFGKERLPDYMVPSAFVLLEKMPLTPNGKVDRKALRDPEQETSESRSSYLAPRSPVEEQLAAIWTEVLHVNRPGVQDNFFELGGDSLLSIQVISRVRETCKVELPLFSLFEAPTIELLADGLQSGTWTQSQLPVLPLQAIPRDGPLPVSFVQERLWFLDQLNPGDHAYNVAAALRIKGALDLPALQRALDEIARRHEALRTTFDYADGNLTQRIAPPAPMKIETVELASSPDGRALNEWLQSESQRPFNLATGPLTRIHVARLAESDHVLLVVMHHIISDGWSLTLLFQELETLYEAFHLAKPAPALPELPLQNADFAAWKRQQMQGTLLEQELNFWKEQLKGAPDAIPLPTDHAEPENLSNRAGRESLQFSRTISEAIAQVSHRQNSTAFVVLTAALCATLEKWTHQRDLVIGTVVAGRNRREMENVIGCFMNFLPIRTRVAGDETGAQLLVGVKTSVLKAQEHQDCPFEKIVEAVNPERHRNQNPLYNVALLLQNFPVEMFRSSHLEISPLPIDLEAALLDLRFEAEWNQGELRLACEYKTDLFEPGTIRELLSCYQQILETILLHPDTRLSECRLTDALETQARAARNREAGLTVAVAATFTAEPIEESLRYWAKKLELPIKPEFAGYNQVFQELLNPHSLLASNSCGLNVLLIRPEDWLQDSGAGTGPRRELRRVATEYVSAIKAATTRTTVPFLTLICPRSDSARLNATTSAEIDWVEDHLALELNGVNGSHVVTTEALLKLYPVPGYYDASGDELGRVPYTPLFFTAIGTCIARKLHAFQRSPHKVIVLDCDNTLWSGVCGEDGAEGICLDAPRQALQEFMRAQQEAGRLLAVCSKNNEEDVREVFARRLDMPLRHEHFVAWRTNWLPKSENIRSLAEELNLGLDSFIFVDDNPVECAEVEASCPEVLTLHLPEEPDRIPQFLQHCWAFDLTQVTAEDRRRGEMYRDNLQREQLRSQAPSLGDFIASLDLKIEITPMSPEQLPRVSQLTHRTNQFNCTTLRRSETDVQKLSESAEILTVAVRDRFGDYGLVGVMISAARGAMLDVETFLLSCRVLGRGVEHAMLAQLGAMALERNLDWVDVHFHRSEKNKPAFDFLESIGSKYRQALNGGFIYRFPAKVAAETSLSLQMADEKAISPATTKLPKADRQDAPENLVESSRQNQNPPPTQLGNRFRRYRSLALEAADPAAIQEAIEKCATKRHGRRTEYAAPQTDTERQIIEIWQKLLHIERVGLKDNFFDLGGHSLLAVRLFADLEKLTGRKLPLVTVFQAPTVEELARVLSDSGSTAQSPIVAVQPNGSRPPLFLAHGAGGDVLWGYANLAKHLPPDQPIYGIKSRGQIGLEELDTIEAMARYYVEEVQKIQPHGPYFLGGYCLGGNVGYEMARQLRAQDEEVALVALIDAFPSNAGYETVTWWQPSFAFRFGRNLWYWLEDFTELSWQERRQFFVRKGRILGRKLISKLRRRSGATTEVDLEEVIDTSYFPEHELKFWEIHLRALVNHVEKPYPGHVTLIRTRGQPFLCSFAEDFCWGRLALDGATVRRIPGSHENIFVEPHVRTLAKALEAALTNSQRIAATAAKNSPVNEPA